MKTADYKQIIAKAQRNIEQAKYREAQTLLEEILKQEDWPNLELQAKAFLWLGRVGLHRGDFNKALMHLKTAQRKSLELGPSWVLLESIRVEGILHSEKGNFTIALDCFKSALEIAKKLKIVKSIAACLNNIALIHQYRGEFEVALDIFDESLAIAVEAEDKEESGKVLNNMAEIFAKKGHYDLAYEHYRRSLVLDKERGDKAGEAIGLNNISEIYKARGDYAKSIEYLQEAYNLVNETGYKPMLGAVLSNLGELHWLEGDLRKATEVLEQGINICNEIGIEDETFWRMMLLLAGVSTDRSNFEKAEALLEACKALNERIQSKLLAAEICYGRGYLEAPATGKGNLGHAKQAYNEALTLAESEELGLTEIWINSSLGLAFTLLGEYLATFEDKFLLEAEQRLGTILIKAKEELQVPILTKVLELQGLLALAQMKHDEALAVFDEARKLANSRGLTYLADKATEQYEKAVRLRAKSQKIMAKDSDSVDSIIQYVKDRVREVQRMVQTYGGG
ncbi:MAG: tetratricopeptide repeat protein [Candidatus Heimdallarchaeota archaeon]